MKATKRDIKQIIYTLKKALSESGNQIFFEAVQSLGDDEKKQMSSVELADKIGEIIDGKDYLMAVFAVTTALGAVYMEYDFEKIENDLREQDSEEKRMWG